jgi:hypothetical protein
VEEFGLEINMLPAARFFLGATPFLDGMNGLTPGKY